jgi:hypothetical protein
MSHASSVHFRGGRTRRTFALCRANHPLLASSSWHPVGLAGSCMQDNGYSRWSLSCRISVDSHAGAPRLNIGPRPTKPLSRTTTFPSPEPVQASLQAIREHPTSERDRVSRVSYRPEFSDGCHCISIAIYLYIAEENAVPGSTHPRRIASSWLSSREGRPTCCWAVGVAQPSYLLPSWRIPM